MVHCNVFYINSFSYVHVNGNEIHFSFMAVACYAVMNVINLLKCIC